MENVRKQYELSHWIYTRDFCLSWMGFDKSRIILLDKNNCGDTDWWRMQGALVHTKHAKIAFGARSSAHGLLSCATLALRMLGGTVFSPKSSCNYAYVSVVVCQNSLWVNVEALWVALMSKSKKNVLALLCKTFFMSLSLYCVLGSRQTKYRTSFLSVILASLTGIIISATWTTVSP